jgi:hypothetical protein
MNKKIKIYEPIYKENQQLEDPSFEPLYIKENKFSGMREFKHLIDLYESGSYLRSEYTGLFSPKFNLKTQITGKTFIDFVNNNSGGDVYFINPFPQIKYWSYNVWMHGEIAHLGLMKAAVNLLSAAQVPLDILKTPRQGSNLLLYSNFWIASQKFWNDYVGNVLKPIYKFVTENSNDLVTIQVMSLTKHTVNAPLLPFIVERLFSTYLSFNPNIIPIAYPHNKFEISEKYCLNDFEKILLVLMCDDVDKADSQDVFSSELLIRMKLACILFQQHHFDFYESKKHPHST